MLENLFETTPWLNLLYLLVGIAGIVITIFIYIRSKKEKKAVYDINSFNLIWNHVGQIEDISIKYKDKNLQNLTASFISIWNRGAGVINKNDIPPLDPLRIEVDENFELLKTEIMYTKNEINNFSVKKENSNSAKINFDYFSKHEGIIMHVYHTGIKNSHIEVSGTIKGMGKIKKGVVPEKYLFEKYIRPYVEYPWKNTEKSPNKFLQFLWILPIAPLGMVISMIEIFMRLNNSAPEEFDIRQ